jgi:probable phosphoglycerate mutase
VTRIALLRHFPTDRNAERRLQGRTDRPLTDDARRRLAGLALPAPWDRAALVASTLSRAAETAAILAAGHGRDPATVRLDARLAEISWGAWEGRRVEDLPLDTATGRPLVHALGRTGRAPGGESEDEAFARARAALAAIARDGPSVVVTHKALMRAILRRAHAPADEAGEVEIGRGRLYPLTIRADGFPEAPEPPLRLVARAGFAA